MPKIASPCPQAKLGSCRRATTTCSCSSTRICRRIHDAVLESCSSNTQTAPICEAKTSQVRAPSRRAKGPKNLQDAAPRYEIQIPKPEDNLLRCSSQISVWGKKRTRSSLLPNGDLLLPFSQIPPNWGTKRARSALIRDPNWRDWTNLGDGPAGLIAERLLASDVADYVSFRAVCRPWRLCCIDPRGHGILDRRFHPRQWIMLRAETGVSPSPLRRSFLNVSTGNSRHIDLPELRGHYVFGPTSEGLLVLLDRTTSVVRLLNPFTQQAAKLPAPTTLMSRSDLEDIDSRGVLLSVSGAGLADDDTFAVHFNMIRTLAVIKPGDVDWTVVDRGTTLLPAMSFAGRFYCATDEAVMVVETSADRPPRLVLAAELSRPFSRMVMDSVHLVDNDGELMLVDRENSIGSSIKYNLHRVDLDARKILPVRGLGGRAVFIGMKLTLSVSPLVFPSISTDTIYLSFETPIRVADRTSFPRKPERSIEDRDTPICGPLGLDYYLAWSITGYGHIFERIY